MFSDWKAYSSQSHTYSSWTESQLHSSYLHFCECDHFEHQSATDPSCIRLFLRRKCLLLFFKKFPRAGRGARRARLPPVCPETIYAFRSRTIDWSFLRRVAGWVLGMNHFTQSGIGNCSIPHEMLFMISPRSSQISTGWNYGFFIIGIDSALALYNQAAEFEGRYALEKWRRFCISEKSQIHLFHGHLRLHVNE